MYFSKMHYYEKMMKENNKILAFQGLRAAACLCIFLYHCGNSQMAQLATWAVSLFFMLSGYLNGYSWKQGKHPECSIKGCVSYMLRKMKKLYLLHILTLLLSVPVSGIFAGGEVNYLFWGIVFVMNVTLTKSFYPDYYFGFNGVSWYLSTYAVLCLITPQLLKGIENVIQRQKKYFSACCVVGLTILCLMYCWLIEKSPLEVEYWVYICPIGRIFEYIAGMLIGMSYDIVPQKIKKPFQWIAIIAVLLCAFSDIPQWLFRTTVWIIPNVLLLWGFHGASGVLTKLMESRIMIFLGGQSAPIFLIHQVAWAYYEKYFQSTYTNKGMAIIAVFLITLVMSLGYTYLIKMFKTEKVNTFIK